MDYRRLKHYSKELVEILGAIGFVDSYRLIEDRGIDPRESDLVMAVFMQLVEVEGYGMIRPGGKAGDGRLVEACPRDSRSRGIAIGSVGSSWSVLRMYQLIISLRERRTFSLQDKAILIRFIDLLRTQKEGTRLSWTTHRSIQLL